MSGKAAELTLRPGASLLRALEEETGEKLSLCYQCKKCSGGCPLSFAMDYRIHEVIRLVQMGAREALLSSNSQWLCCGCKTCYARCPNQIDGSRLMDALKAWTLAEGRVPANRNVPALNEAFLATVKGWGRVFDLGMIAMYKMKTGTYTQDVRLGLELFKRRKLNLWPDRIQQVEEIRAIFRKAGKKI